jgi:amino acid adenylation domain-containing protein
LREKGQAVSVRYVTSKQSRFVEVTTLAGPDQRQLADEWTDAASADGVACVHQQVERAARAHPNAVAVELEGATLTYAELDARATRLARRLRGLGVGLESRVGVCAERSLELVVALLAVLKAGAAYVPLDPAYPAERLAGMIEDGGVRLVLAQPRAAERLPAGAARVERLDEAEAAAAHESPAHFESGAAADTLAYVLFTSGSTGRPKGVMVTHRAVARLLEGGEWCRFEPDEVFLQFVPIAFDVSTFEIWGPLSCGARLVLFPPHTPALDELAGFIRTRGITTLWLSSGLFHPMADENPEAFAGVRRLIAGGDVVSAPHVRRVLEANPHLVFVNGYGPTELTTYTTCHVVRSAGEVGATVPIGRPIARTTVHLLDAALRPVGDGGEGELCGGGAGVARGYQGRPALTAERFVPDPFSSVPGARLYRTGDRARRNPDGTLEYLGRIDQQVKIRGFRVEPGEVEAALAAHPGVRQAAVVAREGRAGRRLVAYVVPADGTVREGREMRAYLRTRLPEYMVPASFVFLDALPVTPNGKVDRRALPSPDEAKAEDREGGHVAPRTPTEELLANAWAEVLGVGRLGVHDDVFALGAHSLAGMRVASRVRGSLGVELPPAAFFEHRTVAELARAAEERAGRAAEFPPIVPGERGEQVPPSFQQESVWFLQELEPAGRSYHFQATLAFRGRLDIPALERTLSEIVRRHELLRTTFPAVDDLPVLRLHEPWAVHLPVIDFSHLPADEREAEVARWMKAQFEVPFDLTELPLMRWSLLKRGHDHHVLVQVEHHMVHDGWSLHLLLGELVPLYAAFAAGRPSPLPELEVQYADYAAWQRRWMESDAARAQLEFWRGRLKGGAPVLELPADRPRPPVPSFRGAAPRFRLPQELYERLRAVGRSRGATLFMTMMATFQAVLSRWSGQTDLRVGTGMANRRQREVERLIGMFVNMTVVRTDAAGDPTFAELLARVRRAVLDAYAHQDVPFDAVVNAVQPERVLGHNPLFQAAFNFHDSPLPDLNLPDVDLEMEVALPNGSAKFDLNVIVIPHSEQRLGRGGGREGMTVVWEYAADLFDATTAERLFAHFRRALEAVAADPELRLSQLPLLDEAERAKVVGEWNRTGAGFPRDSVGALFSDTARRTPDAVALVTREGRVTYGELEARANRLARALRRRGVGPESRVGLCVERGAEQVVALLAILKAGGAYVPLDPAYPPERLAYMARDSALRLVLAQPELADRVPADAAEVLPLDAALAEAAVEDAGEMESGAGPDSLAYVVYTSGSTGQPKGVMVPHRAVVRLVRGNDFMDFSPGQVFLGFAPVAFDASTLELWGPLLNGGSLALHPPEPPSLEQLGDFIRERGVTTLWLTAGLFHQMVEVDPAAFRGVRQLLAGGDVLLPQAVRRVLETNPGLTVINGYGPTEGTTFTTCHPMRSADEVGEPVPLGAPIGNTRAYVLDERMHPVPIGVAGELYAGGEGVARGYQGRPAATAERFVPDPFSSVPGARLYRTGDRVRWTEKESAKVRECVSASDPREPRASSDAQRTPALPHSRTSGVIEFLGRLDTQVKIRGFRIEPGEIEAALVRHPGVREAVVVPRADRSGDRRLVAYFTSEGEAPGAAELRTHLGALLPRHMVPADFVAVDAFPLTANGKVDRRALPAAGPAAHAPTAGAEPRTELEARLAEIWVTVLGVDAVGVHDDFFALGGHSLRATQIVARVRKELGAEIPLRAVFEAPTVAALAERVAAAPRTADDGGIAGIARRARGSVTADELRDALRLHAARAVDEEARAPYVAPRNRDEERLAAIWAEVLERDRVGVDDDFFDLGGHSLLATRIVSRIRQELGVDLPLVALFEAHTVAGLAERLAAAPRVQNYDGEEMGRIQRAPRTLDELREELTPQAGPARVDVAAAPYVAPRTPTEELLAAIWAEVLERDRVGADDDFFALGGHSLLATLVVSRVKQTLGVSLPLRALFETPTLAGFARVVDEARPRDDAAEGGRIGRRPREAQSLERLRDTLQTHAAPRDETAGPAAYAPPRTDTERDVAAIWAEVMELPRVGVHDDFLMLGGHSLVATRILSRVGERFGVQLPLRALMDAGTVEVLAGRIDRARGAASASAARAGAAGEER